MKKTDVFVVFFLLVASIFTLNDLFIPGFFTSHDGPHQIVRAYYFHELINDGQFPPRWVGGLNFGFGYPLFIFSYHIPWVIAEFFRISGLGVIDAVKMTFLTGFLLSGIFMFFFLKSLFGRLPAFVGTCIYLYAPFRFSNIFVRAAIGDATAFVFAPLLFWSFVKLKRNISLLPAFGVAVSMALLILSHAMVAFFYLSGFALYAIFSLVTYRKKIKLLLYLFLSFIFFIGYSAYYLMPSFIERSYTKFDSALGSIGLNVNFTPLSKLIYSPWGYGTIDAPFGSMSLSIGFAQIAVFVIAVFLLFYKIIIGRNFKASKSEGLFFASLFLLTVFMMLPPSKLIWRQLSEFIVIDFNWRILSLTVFASSVLAGWVIKNISNNGKIRATLGLLLLVIAFFTNRNHLRINQSLDWDMPFFLKLEKTTNSFDEYLPRWADNAQVRENSDLVAANPELQYEIVGKKNHLFELKVNAKEDSSITLNHLYYPGWMVFDNGRKNELTGNSGGLLVYPVSRGSHDLKFVFGKTPLRSYSDILTISAIVLTGIIIIGKKSHA